jgi:hypothetical protein
VYRRRIWLGTSYLKVGQTITYAITTPSAIWAWRYAGIHAETRIEDLRVCMSLTQAHTQCSYFPSKLCRILILFCHIVAHRRNITWRACVEPISTMTTRKARKQGFQRQGNRRRLRGHLNPHAPQKMKSVLRRSTKSVYGERLLRRWCSSGSFSPRLLQFTSRGAWARMEADEGENDSAVSLPPCSSTKTANISYWDTRLHSITFSHARLLCEGVDFVQM